MKMKKVLSSFLAGAIFVTSFSILGQSESVSAATVNSIPNTTRSIKEYDKSFLSLTGYASDNNGVNDRSKYIGTSYYRTVRNEREFLKAIADARNGKVKAIEVVNDLNLGWKELNLSQAERTQYGFISKYGEPMNGYTNPTIESAGVSKLDIANTNGLTIFSTKGNTIKHVELKLQSSSNDIAIRNLNFADMWQWDDSGKHKEVGWTFIKVNGANNVWLDHCKFSIAADGMVDIENGSSGITFSWCEFRLEANENLASDSTIYKTINYMEQKYNSNKLNSNSLYYKMRKGGASKNQIMAYTAYHSKCHLVGSGDKDFVNYVDGNGKEVKDGNQRLRLTLAYCKYNNVGQRVPMIRQGVGHMFNCYINDSTHNNILNKLTCTKTEVLARGINARNGASIAADTCVFNGVSEPIVGTEMQGQDTSNMNAPWGTIFKNAYNRALIVNSKVTNKNGTYTGSSWDNNGDNLFTKGFTWKDKSTIGKWAWSSSIVGVNNMKKTETPTKPFDFVYNYNEKLPYAYNVVPLNKVEATVNRYSGSGKVAMSNKEWLQTRYSTSSSSVNPTPAPTPSNTGVTQVYNGSYYRIKNVNSGKYLGVYNDNFGTAVIQTSNTSDNSIWQVVGAENGYVQLAAQVGDGLKILDVAAGSRDNGAKMQIWGNGNGDHQKFKIKSNGDGTFAILSKISGDYKGLDVNGYSKNEGANVIQYNYSGSANQRWIFEKINYTHPIVDGATYYIKNYNSNLYLDVKNGEDANGANIRQWTGNGADAQKFKVVSTGDGYYKLVSQVGSKKRVVDVNGNKATNGQNISLYDDRGTDNQKFKLISLGNGVYQLVTKVSGNKSLIEVANASKDRGANVQQWSNNSNNCQKWVLEIVR